MPDLYWHTVDKALEVVLLQLMEEPLFEPFRLVGGTALSLQLGHRKSEDIDLFTDVGYDEINFEVVDHWLRQRYNYVNDPTPGPVGFGRSYAIGSNAEEAIKLDIYHTDPFIRPALEVDIIRIATVEEIAAMKIDVVQRTGRKKDFWDIHELLDHYTLSAMIDLHREKYPYNHNETVIKANMIDFSAADGDFDPICLRGKYWEVIKLDLLEHPELGGH
jgi:predicted nucleotidyltransferase component of viral defense system